MLDKARIDRILARLPELEALLADPVTLSNPKKLRELVREHSALKSLSDKAIRYFRLEEELIQNREMAASDGTDDELRAMAREEIARAEAELPAARQSLMAALLPPDPNHSRNAIFEVRAGTGGDEAALFAGDLFRMYSRYCEGRGWKVAVIDAAGSDLGGYKEVVFEVQGDGAYGRLQFESGGHRVQRVPVTEAQGRIHTSAATVAVFPEVEADDDIEIKPDEIRIDIFCSSGPGGQSVNTTYSAIRITHLPTGTVAQSQEERSQQRNKERAMAVLKSRLLDQRRREEAERKGNARRALTGSGDRSERVRTYNFPQNRLTDHRINLTLYSLDRIIEGDLDAVLDALHQNDVETRLAEELGESA